MVGRKRHVVVDTLGLLWALVITPASVQDRDGGRLALIEFRRHVKFPRVIWADQAYRALVDWALVKWLWLVELVRRPHGRSNCNRRAGSSNAPSAGSTGHVDWPSHTNEPPKAMKPSSKSP